MGEECSDAGGLPPGLLVIVLVFTLLTQFYYAGWLPDSVPSADLPSLYLGSYAVREGISPYSVELQRMAATVLGKPVFPYLSPPPSLLLVSPLIHWPFESVASAVLIGNYLATAVSVFLLFFVSGLGSRAVGARCIVAVFVVSAFPTRHTIVHGQFNLLVLVLLCLGCLALMRETRGGWAGILFALATLLKQSPALMFGLLLVRRRWFDVMAGAGVLGAAFVIGAFTLPSQAWTDWAERVAPSLRFGHTPWNLFHPGAPSNQSINGFLSRLFADSEWNGALVARPELVEPVASLLAVLILVATGRVLWRDRHGGRRSLGIDFGLVLATMFMVAPLSWDHHLVMVFPALCVAAVESIRHRRPTWEKAVLAAAVLLVTLPLRLDLPILRSGVPTLLVSVRLIGVGLLWLVLMRLGGAQRSAEASGPPFKPCSTSYS